MLDMTIDSVIGVPPLKKKVARAKVNSLAKNPFERYTNQIVERIPERIAQRVISPLLSFCFTKNQNGLAISTITGDTETRMPI
jgi:hypothetical protein